MFTRRPGRQDAAPPTPTYEGRELPRPGEELVDQGLAFDLGTLDRRHLLGIFGLGAAGLALAACGSGTPAPEASSRAATTAADGTATPTGTTASTTLSEIPDETAGPYPGNGSNGPDVLEQSGVVRSDIRSSFAGAIGTAEGVPMTLTLTILDIAGGGGPLAGAAVYVWHCDRGGGYSMYSDGITDQNYLRGVQISDSAGAVTFTSIFPGCYPGRWPHVHFEVYPAQADITDSTKAIATSQVALPKSACEAAYATAGYESSATNLGGISLTTDNVFRDDGGVHQIATVTGDAMKGYAANLTVPIDTATGAQRRRCPAQSSREGVTDARSTPRLA